MENMPCIVEKEQNQANNVLILFEKNLAVDKKKSRFENNIDPFSWKQKFVYFCYCIGKLFPISNLVIGILHVNI